MTTASVRYIVDDVDAAIAFYCQHLGFQEQMHPAPTFAMLMRGDLRLVLSAPSEQGGGGQAMPDGTLPEPGGWNRFSIEIDDLETAVVSLRDAGAHFRNDIVTGVGGKQILVDDPAGNPVELFEPTLAQARLDNPNQSQQATPQPPGEAAIEFPGGSHGERQSLLNWLRFLRGAVLRKIAGLTDEQARWRPAGKLVSLLGIVNHLTHVEWRWIDGGILGRTTSRSESEFHPGAELTVADAIIAYRHRAEATDAAIVQARSLEEPCSKQEGTDLRWVVLHLINETARHAGHADAVRELLDGTTGE